MTGASPEVTVVTPTRNRARLLAQTLDSVAAQTLQDWEHIVVDDGSEDGAAELVADRQAQDPRVRYLARRTPHAGANVCRNLGAAHASADLIVFLDDDDLLAPRCLQQRVELMRRNQDLAFAVFRAEIFIERAGDFGRLYHPLDPADNLLRFLSLDCPWQTTGPIWRRSFFEGIGGFDESLPSMQDLELHVRALSREPLYAIGDGVDHYIRGNQDPARTSTRHFNDPGYIRAAEGMSQRLMQVLADRGLLTWSRRRALLGLGFTSAESWAKIGRPMQALAAWRRTADAFAAPPLLRYAGAALLVLRAADRRHEGVAARIVNRWKGEVRFRQEPSVDLSPSPPAREPAAAARAGDAPRCQIVGGAESP